MGRRRIERDWRVRVRLRVRFRVEDRKGRREEDNKEGTKGVEIHRNEDKIR